MVKNKDLPDSAAPPVWSLSLSLSLSLPRRLGPIKAGLTCLLLPMPLILRVPPGSCWGWTPAPFPLWPLQIYCALWTFQIPMQYCSLQHWTLLSSSDTFTTGWFFFFFHFGSASSFLQTIHGVLKIRMLKWFAIPISSGMRFVRTCHHDPSFSGGPAEHGSQFHWVRHGCTPCDQLVSCSGLTWIILTNTQDYERHSAGRSCWRATPQENTEHIFIGNLSCNL